MEAAHRNEMRTDESNEAQIAMLKDQLAIMHKRFEEAKDCGN
jgi:hypothetical protein